VESTAVHAVPDSLLPETTQPVGSRPNRRSTTSAPLTSSSASRRCWSSWCKRSWSWSGCTTSDGARPTSCRGDLAQRPWYADRATAAANCFPIPSPPA